MNDFGEMHLANTSYVFLGYMQIAEKTNGPGMPFPEESLALAKDKLAELNKRDAERRRTAELKNNLEGYIYSTREKVHAFLIEFNLTNNGF